jgi:hypothetical protein
MWILLRIRMSRQTLSVHCMGRMVRLKPDTYNAPEMDSVTKKA